MPKQSQALLVQAQTLTLQAQQLEVATPQQAETAAEFLSQANRVHDAIIAEEEKITAPAQLIIKTERAKRAPAKKALKEIIATLRDKLSAYQTQATQEARIAEQKIAARVAPGKGNLSLETAAQRLAAIPAPEENIAGTSGRVSFRPKQTLKITDSTKIPPLYLIPDEDKILDDLKAGITIPGCEIEIIQTVYNKRS